LEFLLTITLYYILLQIFKVERFIIMLKVTNLIIYRSNAYSINIMAQGSVLISYPKVYKYRFVYERKKQKY